MPKVAWPPAMAQTWSLQHQYELWFRIELQVCEALAELGKIPPGTAAAIAELVNIDADQIVKTEIEMGHDVAAFLVHLFDQAGDFSRYLHQGLTSSDLRETAQALQLQMAADILLAEIERASRILKELILEHKLTPMPGRTHGTHAQPITLGLKLANWYDELQRQRDRLRRARETISVGKLSGAVGTFAHINPHVEESVCRKLGLKAAPIASQVLQRDRIGEYVTTLALIATSVEKFVTEIRNLQRTEVGEIEEHRPEHHWESTALPHKRNPFNSERISGLARLLRGYALAAMENCLLWHERDASHLEVEMRILPESTSLLGWMLQAFADMLQGLTIHRERMLENLEMTRGLVHSQDVLLALVAAGMPRQQAYAMVDRLASECTQKQLHFIKVLGADAEVRHYLSPEKLAECFELDRHFKQVDHILNRVFSSTGGNAT